MMGIWLWDIMGYYGILWDIINLMEMADYVSSNLYLILVKLVK